jgi:hypothetical protein
MNESTPALHPAQITRGLPDGGNTPAPATAKSNRGSANGRASAARTATNSGGVTWPMKSTVR